MIYTTGTIAISGNTLTGTGTNFTAAGSLIRNGCTVIALTSPAQVFQITAIGSATSLTVTPAANPAIPAGTKYAILLSDSLSVDGLAQDIAETFTMYQRYMSGFADVMNGTTDVTITINGTAVTVPGQKSLAKKGSNSDITSLSGLTTALSISQGGTGGKTASESRTNLGLGSGSTATLQTSVTDATAGRLLVVGGFGIGEGSSASGTPVSGGIDYFSEPTGLWQTTADTTGVFPTDTSKYGQFFRMRGGKNSITQIYATGLGVAKGGRIWYRTQAENVATPGWQEFYTTYNTTKASDGTLKAASPVARIVKSQEECQRTDIDEPGYEWCGCGTANAEAEGISVTRLDVGVYVLTGSAGLASEGWTLLPPMDPGGMGELGVVEAEQTESGGLTIRLFKRKYMLSEEGEIVKTKGAPIDVPANSWIDVRLDMPEDSVWNKRQKESSEAAIKEPAS
ncbi:phage tail fiber protein [Enterobacter ludwigii]|uniref:phage tail fiber protein n=1 Tax=Enterobacter ludwigii TaxID=299767 RepID=UPI00123AE16B|nr:phage tail protein [Enterobacter ludwigii]